MMSIHQRNAAIGDMMNYVAGLTADGQVQVAVVASAFIATCVHHNLPKDVAVEIVANTYDNACDLITLERPSRLS